MDINRRREKNNFLMPKGQRYSPYSGASASRAAVQIVGEIGRRAINEGLNQAGKAVVQKAKNMFSRSKSKSKGKEKAKPKYIAEKYRTTGRWVGKFRKRRFRKKVGVAFRSGAVTLSERRGTITDSHCVYVGHSTNPREGTVKNVLRCILKVGKIVIVGAISAIRCYDTCVGRICAEGDDCGLTV